MEEKRSKRSAEQEKPARSRSDRNRRKRRADVEVSRFATPMLADIGAEFWDDDVLDVTVDDLRPADSAPVLRPDSDVLAWFKSQGSDWQSRMNAVLRAHMARARALPRD